MIYQLVIIITQIVSKVSLCREVIWQPETITILCLIQTYQMVSKAKPLEYSTNHKKAAIMPVNAPRIWGYIVHLITATPCKSVSNKLNPASPFNECFWNYLQTQLNHPYPQNLSDNLISDLLKKCKQLVAGWNSFAFACPPSSVIADLKNIIKINTGFEGWTYCDWVYHHK